MATECHQIIATDSILMYNFIIVKEHSNGCHASHNFLFFTHQIIYKPEVDIPKRVRTSNPKCNTPPPEPFGIDAICCTTLQAHVFPQIRLDSFTFVFIPVPWQLFDSYEHDYPVVIFRDAVFCVFEDVISVISFWNINIALINYIHLCPFLEASSSSDKQGISGIRWNLKFRIMLTKAYHLYWWLKLVNTRRFLLRKSCYTKQVEAIATVLMSVSNVMLTCNMWTHNYIYPSYTHTCSTYTCSFNAYLGYSVTKF